MQSVELPALEPQEVQDLTRDGTVVLDIRHPRPFCEGHIPGAVNVGFSIRHMGERVHTVLPDLATPLVIVGDDEDEVVLVAESVLDAGFANLRGYLAGGMDAWQEAGLDTARIPLLDTQDFRQAAEDPDAVVLDVREPFEWNMGYIEGAVRIPLGDLPGRMEALPKDKHIVVTCESGLRSGSAASLLRYSGFDDVSNAIEGMYGWRKRNLPTVT
jgi:hydroxyacylglutathione hydrolase